MTTTRLLDDEPAPDDEAAPDTPRQPADVERLAHVEAQGGQLLDEMRALGRRFDAIEQGFQITAQLLERLTDRVGSTDQRVQSLSTAADARERMYVSALGDIRADLALVRRRVDALCGLLREDSTQREEPADDATSQVRHRT